MMIAKSFLEIEADIRSKLMVTNLKEFEAYIRNNWYMGWEASKS